MPRFAILTHDHPFLHWDLLLENGPMCRTWRLLDNPNTQGEIRAESLPDHRLMYLNYEGPVSGDRGMVSCWDAGSFEWQINQLRHVELILSGRRLNGVARLTQTDDLSWTWHFEGVLSTEY